jgi:hypothetical protein
VIPRPLLRQLISSVTVVALAASGRAPTRALARQSTRSYGDLKAPARDLDPGYAGPARRPSRHPAETSVASVG